MGKCAVRWARARDPNPDPEQVGLANEKKLDGMKTAEPQAEAKADAPKTDDQKQA